MKIPSLSKLFEEASATFKRFPFVILASMLGAFLMIFLIEKDAEPGRDYQRLYNVVMCCGLGISFLLSLTLRNEVFKLDRIKNYIAQGVGIVFLIAYYFWLPKELSIIDIIRFILFALGFHFLVSFSPFMNKDADRQQNIDAFWRYNKLFFLRILLTVLFSGVLFAGLSVAILSFDKLFNADIGGRIYPQLFFLILGVFNTWFFLAGIPENLNELYEEEVYPKVLKIFTQFVLLPLVTVYLLILYMYMGKIIVLWNLPEGWVSYLILCFSIAGILSLLLIYPIRNHEENRWIKVFSKWFYIALLPLVVLLFTAILTRLFTYGITERRYFVFVLACWLTFIALYFLISKTKNIKVIPITLCLLCFVTSFGPWGAFAVSERSQMNRLEKLLTENKILVDGKIKPLTDKTITTKDEGSISSILDFLTERKETMDLHRWFDKDLDSIKNKSSYEQTSEILKLMGLKYTYYRDGSNERETFYYNFSDTALYNIQGFDYYSKISLRGKDNYDSDNMNDNGGALDSVKVKFYLESIDGNPKIRITYNKEYPVLYDLQEFVRTVRKENPSNKSQVYGKGFFTVENDFLKVEINLKRLSGYFMDEKITLTNMEGIAFIKIKKKQ